MVSRWAVRAPLTGVSRTQNLLFPCETACPLAYIEARFGAKPLEEPSDGSCTCYLPQPLHYFQICRGWNMHLGPHRTAPGPCIPAPHHWVHTLVHAWVTQLSSPHGMAMTAHRSMFQSFGTRQSSVIKVPNKCQATACLRRGSAGSSAPPMSSWDVGAAASIWNSLPASSALPAASVVSLSGSIGPSGGQDLPLQGASRISLHSQQQGPAHTLPPSLNGGNEASGRVSGFDPDSFAIQQQQSGRRSANASSMGQPMPSNFALLQQHHQPYSQSTPNAQDLQRHFRIQQVWPYSLLRRVWFVSGCPTILLDWICNVISRLFAAICQCFTSELF